MIRCLQAELFKLVRRRTSWLTVVGLALLPVLLGLIFRSSAVQTTGPQGPERVTISCYGLLMLTISTAVALFAPLVASFIAAELLAKEIKEGTLKLLFMRPVSRSQVLLSKGVVACLHNVALITVLFLVTFLVGITFFSCGPVDQAMSAYLSVGSPAGRDSQSLGQVKMSGVTDRAEALTRIGATYAYLAFSLTTVGLLTLFLSTFIANTAGVVLVTLGLLIGMRLLENIERFKPYLLSAHLINSGLLSDPIDWTGIGFSLGVLAIYATTSLLGGVLILRQKDIAT